MAIQDYFTSGHIIQRQGSGTSNGMGGKSQVWNTHLTIDGLLDKVSGNEKLMAGQQAESSTHIFITDANQDIKSSDRISSDSKIYRILDVDNPMNMDSHFETLLKFEGVDQDD